MPAPDRVFREDVFRGQREDLFHFVRRQRVAEDLERAACDFTNPAAPAAWPVALLPVSPTVTMGAWPPYWVRPELRNHVPTGTWLPAGIPKVLRKVPTASVLPEAIGIGDGARDETVLL